MSSITESIMTKVVFFMLLGAAAAPSVRAGDTKDSLRNVMDICNQFIINDPDPGFRLHYHNDCHIYDDSYATTGVEAPARARQPHGSATASQWRGQQQDLPGVPSH
jgi:hypothetical protein